MHFTSGKDVYFNHNGDYSGWVHVTPSATDEERSRIVTTGDIPERARLQGELRARQSATEIQVPFADLVAVALGSAKVATLTHDAAADPDMAGRTLQITRRDAQHLVGRAESMRLITEIEQADDDFLMASVRERVEAAGTLNLRW